MGLSNEELEAILSDDTGGTEAIVMDLAEEVLRLRKRIAVMEFDWAADLDFDNIEVDIEQGWRRNAEKARDKLQAKLEAVRGRIRPMATGDWDLGVGNEEVQTELLDILAILDGDANGGGS